jgi:hypothetical protein
MIPIASGLRVWIANGHTDMRRGMNLLASKLRHLGSHSAAFVDLDAGDSGERLRNLLPTLAD